MNKQLKQLLRNGVKIQYNIRCTIGISSVVYIELLKCISV